MYQSRKSRSSSQRRKTMKSQAGRILRMVSMEKHASAMNGLIRRGPATIILVFSNTCSYCHTYMPIWKKLCQTQGRKANMISMEASTYKQTPMSEKKPVSGVPTVLYVNKQGEIAEIEEPRNTTTMKSYIRNTPPAFTQVKPPVSTLPIPMAVQPSQPMSVQPSQPMSVQPSQPMSGPTESGSSTIRTANSPLKPLPATGGRHKGGNWSAIISAAQQAAPAAALLGAYAAFPMQRSSGLGPCTRKSRRRS